MKFFSSVWGLCVLLFLAGVTWGSVRLSSEFYQVNSIHDFFDILGVIVTVIAVVVALRGIGEWRNQAVATTDHELARRLLIELYRYREAIGHIRSPVMMAYEGRKEGEEFVVYESVELIRKAYGERFEKLGEVKAVLLVNILESEAVWGGAVRLLFKPLFSLERELFIHIRTYMIVNDPKQPEDMRDSYSEIMRGQRDILYEVYGGEDEFLRDINLASATIESALRPKLLRSK